MFQPFTDDFPRADIRQLLSPDLLHQLIKGGFHDHLVTWVDEFLDIRYGKTRAKEIKDDINRRYGLHFVSDWIFVTLILHGGRIALAPAFPGLRRFPEGRGFKQWTGDDSKALMKVRSLLASVCFVFSVISR